VDSASGDPMSKVSIKNLTTKNGSLSNYSGEFTIEIGDDNYLQITYLGYRQKVIRIRNPADYDFLRVELAIQKGNLPTVTIRRPLTQYQMDSLERATLYEDIYGYQRQKSAFSPITSLYQKFSKKHKNIQKFQAQIREMEEQNFIDTRYTPDVTAQVTKLEGDSLAKFMNLYPMEHAYARTASDLEIRMWIKYNWEDYKKKHNLQ
jgi:hypothetical protein